MRHLLLYIFVAVIALATSAKTAVELDGFIQGLFGAKLEKDNPIATEFPVSETRFQLRAQHWGDRGQAFARLDFLYDDADPNPTIDLDVREAYFKFRLGGSIDVKVGRQILNWGTGDLIFINDVFAKDYQSFFLGREDQYLKAPQNALRIGYYSPLGELNVVLTPRFTPNILPTGDRLSFFNPMVGSIVANDNYQEAKLPDPKFKNSEIATRLSRPLGNFKGSIYFYRGFFKNPIGFDPVAMLPAYSRLNVYGASLRGTLSGGVLWLEGGYFDSRDDKNGDNPTKPNSTINALIGFERQIASNLTANVQWQVEYMFDHDLYHAGIPPGDYVKEQKRSLLTTRWTKLLNSELITLSFFTFYSPTDKDAHIRLSGSYKYTDEIDLTLGANIFNGENQATEFGQLMLNDNMYMRLTYGF